MPHFLHRKSAPAVRSGRVCSRNNWAQTPDYDITPQPRPFIDRQRPGAGYRHLLLRRDVQRFVELLPNWPTLSEGLNAIVLAPGSDSLMGWHRPGVVAVCAWERDLCQVWSGCFVAEVSGLLDRLGVEREAVEESTTRILCRFTEVSARGFQLLDVLLHELGHHHDRMTTRSRRVGRGEPYAERYAVEHADLIWERYVRAFGW